MARPREVLPHAVPVPDSGSVAAQRAESFDIDRCPNDASSVLAGDRKAGTARRIPDRPTSTRPHAPGAHAPLRRSTSTRRVPRATVLEPPESGHTDLDLALAHYLPLPTLFPDEPFKLRKTTAGNIQPMVGQIKLPKWANVFRHFGANRWQQHY